MLRQRLLSAISGLVQVRRSNDTIGLSLPLPHPHEGSRPGPLLPVATGFANVWSRGRQERSTLSIRTDNRSGPWAPQALAQRRQFSEFFRPEGILKGTVLKRFLLALVLMGSCAVATSAQTVTGGAKEALPFSCPPGTAGQELLYFRGTSLAPNLQNGLHRVSVKYPPAGKCGHEPALEGLWNDNGTPVIPSIYAAMQPFSTTLAIARRTDGVTVFIDLATKAEKPFPYIRYLRDKDIAVFGIVSDDPETQTSDIAMLSRETGEPIAQFERIIGVINTEMVGALDWRKQATPLRQRTEDGGEQVIWVNAEGIVNRISPPVTTAFAYNTREVLEVVGPSPFPDLWPEMFVPVQGSGERWPLPADVLGFAFDPLRSDRQVAFLKRGTQTLIYTGRTPFFLNPDYRRGWSLDKGADLYFENMAIVAPKQKPVAEYTAERYAVVREPGAAGWKPLGMELPDPGFTRPTPQAALDEAIIAYNARMENGGLAELAARQAAEKAASDRAMAKWQAERDAEAARYQALVKKARTSNVSFTDDELRFAFEYEAASFNSDFRYAAPDYWERYQGLKIVDELRALAVTLRQQPHETTIYEAERRARSIGDLALQAFAQAYPLKDTQSKVILCSAGQTDHCYKPPIAASVYQSAGYDGNAAMAASDKAHEAFIARERAINTANCARASMGAIIGCGQP